MLYSEPIVCYLEFIVGDFQHTNCSVDVVFPLDRLPVIRVFRSNLKTNSSRSRIYSTVQVGLLKIRNTFTAVYYQYAIPGNTVLHFIITHAFFLIHSQNRHCHVFALATQNCLCLDPGFIVMFLDGLVLCSLYSPHRNYLQK